MINVDIGSDKIRENIFTASLSRRCCVLETFLISSIGFKSKDIQKWILSLSEADVKSKVIRLEGAVLEDFKAEYLQDPSYASVDSLYMITSDGLRSLFAHYTMTNKRILTKTDRMEIEKLSLRYISIFSAIRTERISHLVFWEEEVKDEISIPDMANINISNSQGTVITVGDRNHHIEPSTNTTSNNKVSKDTQTVGVKQKPKWLMVLSWIFIIGFLLCIIISICVKYSETQSFENFHIDWKEWVSLGGLIIGILLKMY